MAIWRNASEAYMGADPDEGMDVDAIIESIRESFQEPLLVSITRGISDPQWDFAQALLGVLLGLDQDPRFPLPEALQGPVTRLRGASGEHYEGPNDEDVFYGNHDLTEQDTLDLNAWVETLETQHGHPTLLRFSIVGDFDAIPERMVQGMVEDWEAPSPDYCD